MTARFGTPQDIRVFVNPEPSDTAGVYGRRPGEFTPCTRDHPDRFIPPCRSRGDHSDDERCGILGCSDSIRWLDPKPILLPLRAAVDL